MTAERQDLLALIERLATDDPTEQIMDGYVDVDVCRFCRAEKVGYFAAGRGYRYALTHTDDCPWVEARKLLGK